MLNGSAECVMSLLVVGENENKMVFRSVFLTFTVERSDWSTSRVLNSTCKHSTPLLWPCRMGVGSAECVMFSSVVDTKEIKWCLGVFFFSCSRHSGMTILLAGSWTPPGNTQYPYENRQMEVVWAAACVMSLLAVGEKEVNRIYMSVFFHVFGKDESLHCPWGREPCLKTPQTLTKTLSIVNV